MAYSFTSNIGVPKLRDLSFDVNLNFDLDERCQFYFTNNL